VVAVHGQVGSIFRAVIACFSSTALDFDRNGVKDLLLFTLDGVMIFFGAISPSTGALSFSQNPSFVSQIAPLTNATWLDVAVSDFDNDGRLDIAVAAVADQVAIYRYSATLFLSSFSSHRSVLLSNTPTGFVPVTAPGPCAGIPSTPRAIAFDWNNDNV
jgi:hypothetical protein